MPRTAASCARTIDPISNSAPACTPTAPIRSRSIDRITDYKILEQTFSLPYATRFQEGEFRKRVQFMYPGRLQRIRLRYTGTSVEAILDRLPTAKIISQDEKGSVIEAEVYGNGIVMWLLSQGNRIEVLEPQALRDEMKKILTEMLEQYKDGTEV